MCRKFIIGSSLNTIKSRYNLEASSINDWDKGRFVSPGEETLIITQQNPKEIVISTFGMTPEWAKRPMQLINARTEGDKNPANNPSFTGSKAIFLKPAFQKPLISKRCIIVADAFIEWSADGQPYLIYLQNHERPFMMAGLYDIWTNPATLEKFHSFTIITVPGNSLIQKLPASRMPVILEKGRESRWLKPDSSLREILGQLQKYTSKLMNAHPISKENNKSVPYSPDLLKPIGERLLSESRIQLPSYQHYHHKDKRIGNDWSERKIS